jgi:hypothetical protein
MDQMNLTSAKNPFERLLKNFRSFREPFSQLFSYNLLSIHSMHRLRQKLIMQTELQKQIIRMLPVETYTPFLFATNIAQQNPLFLCYCALIRRSFSALVASIRDLKTVCLML